MSESQAKASRRDLRRAIGPAAAEQVRDLGQAIGILQNVVAGLQRELAASLVDHVALKQTYIEHVNQQTKRDEAARTFRGRLRLLFKGR